MGADWIDRAIGEFASRKKVINLSGENLPPFSVTKDRGVILQSDRYKKRIATDPRKYVIVEDGDFAFDPMSLYYGSLGRVVGLGKGIISPDYVAFTVDQSVDPSFLEYLLRSPDMVQKYERVAQQGNQFGKRRRVYWAVLKEQLVRLPPRAEQRRIAEILVSVDDVIDRTAAVISHVEVVKRALMAELLTRGMPGKHKEFKESLLGLIPSTWRVEPLSSVVAQDTSITYGIVQAGPNVPHGVPYLRTGDVKEAGIDISKLGRTSPEIAGHFKRSEVRAGDLVICIRASIGTVVRVPPELDGANLTQGTARIAPGPQVVPQYLLWALRSSSVQAWIDQQSKGSTFREITLGRLREVPVQVPTILEQTEIAGALDALEVRARSEARALDACRALRQALLAALLSGRVRCPVATEAGA